MAISIVFSEKLKTQEIFKFLKSLQNVVTFPSVATCRGVENFGMFGQNFTNLDDGNNIFLSKISEYEYVLSWRTGFSTPQMEKGLVDFVSGLTDAKYALYPNLISFSIAK